MSNSTCSLPYKRVIVTRCDDTFIYGQYADDSKQCVRISLKNNNADRDIDFTYLKELLKKGSQVNIIEPAIAGDIVFPLYIVLSPDYLIDISAIASCFEDYGQSHLIYLANKLKQRISNSSIILGNFASQFLDEELSITADENTYEKSVEKFFHNNIINLLTTALTPDFHKQARRQKENIKYLLTVELPRMVPDFVKENVVVEPSFFSEMLGLQGRMDFLQLDFAILIEQKSGKAQLLKHKVQMLLYMFLLKYSHNNFTENDAPKTRSFLLYSYYREGLQQQSFDEELLQKALKIRNEIVAMEYSLAEGDTRQLLQLTADDLNTSNTNSYLWRNYQRKELETLLSAIGNASVLERKYYSRFIQFIAREHQLSKIGGQIATKGGFADKWNVSLRQKIADGCICNNLKIIAAERNSQKVIDCVTLQSNDSEHIDLSDFRRGDIVVLYAYKEGNTPDLRNQIVYRTTIEQIRNNRITLSLRSPLSDSRQIMLPNQYNWAIEHDMFETLTTTLYRGLHSFLSAPKERRDLLLLQRNPKQSKDKKLNGNYGEFNDLMLKVKQADDFFLIIGPPGTGKTSFGMLYTLKEELTADNSRVLVMAYTNRAVDEICSKLSDENIDFIRLGSKASCDEMYEKHLLSARTENCKTIDEARKMVESARIIVGTTASLSASALLQRMTFSLAIIDEASQIIEPNIIGILSATTDNQPSVKRFVMIGDHKQLPAVVVQSRNDSHVADEMLHEIALYDCRNSLFERLLNRYQNDDSIVGMLTKQGRMHREIAEFPSRMFYNGKLSVANRDTQCCQLTANKLSGATLYDRILSKRMAFIDCNASTISSLFEDDEALELCDTTQNIGKKVNFAEAKIAAKAAYNIYVNNKSTFDAATTIGIIVPYRNQIAAIRQCLNKYDAEGLEDITIDTVERFQGSQRDFIIFSTTISDDNGLTFLTDNQFTDNGSLIDRKLNVVLTRARKHFIIVGNSYILKHDRLYEQLIAHINKSQ